MKKTTNKSIRLLLIGFITLGCFHIIYEIIKPPFDIVEVILNAFILICFGMGIRHHIKNINEPIGQELKNNFIWYLIFVGIVSVIVFGAYKMYL